MDKSEYVVIIDTLSVQYVTRVYIYYIIYVQLLFSGVLINYIWNQYTSLYTSPIVMDDLCKYFKSSNLS